MGGAWLARMTLKGPCNLRILCSRTSDGNQETESPAKYFLCFEMEIRLFQFRNQIKANSQGVSTLCSSRFDMASKEGRLLFPG